MQQTYHLGSFLSDDTTIIYDPNAKNLGVFLVLQANKNFQFLPMAFPLQATRSFDVTSFSGQDQM